MKEPPLMKAFWTLHNKLGSAEMARRSNVRAQHICDVANGRRAPNLQLVDYLGFEKGFVRKAKETEPNGAAAPSTTPEQTSDAEA